MIEIVIGLSVIVVFYSFFSIQPLKGVNNWLLSIVLLSVIILVFFLSRWIKAEDFFSNKFVAMWSIPFVFIAIYTLITASWHPELIYTYQTLFIALSNNWNPYVQHVIYHRLADGTSILSTFNYLPGEIIPYYIGYLLSKQWNFGIMLAINFFINFIATFIIIFQIPNISRSNKLFYSLLLLFTSITHSASFVFFLIMLASLLLLNQRKDVNSPKLRSRLTLVLIMGVGTVAKFFMLPFIFLYFWNSIIEKRKFSYIIDFIGVGMIFLVFTIPFGIYNVIYSTIIFNLNLSQRAHVTTYYVNIVSGFCYYAHLQIFYGLIAVSLFFMSVILTKNIPFHKRILYVSLITLIIFPTPEDQFIGSIFGLLVISKLDELKNSKYSFGSDSLFHNITLSKLNLFYSHIKNIRISKNKQIFQQNSNANKFN